MNKTLEVLNVINEQFAQSLMGGNNPFEALAAAPINQNTKREYTGFNRLVLSYFIKEKAWESSGFMTFKQTSDAGGRVKKGEKASPVFYTSWVYEFSHNGSKIKVTAFNNNEAIDLASKKVGVTLTQKDIIKKSPFVKFFYVFNLSQTEGIEYKAIENPTPISNAELILANAIANGLKIKSGKIESYSNGVLTMPQINLFEEDEGFYPDIFKKMSLHFIDAELQHFEKEMIASIASAFLSQACGFKKPAIEIEGGEMIQKWLDAINESPYFLKQCAAKAQTVFDLLVVSSAEEEEAA